MGPGGAARCAPRVRPRVGQTTVKGPTNRDVSRETGTRGERWGGSSLAWLEEQFVEAYVCWREACTDVEGAYALLDTSHRRDRGLALAAFDAALDREESAAWAYREAANSLRSASDHHGTVGVP